MVDDQAFQGTGRDPAHDAGLECRALTVGSRTETGRRPMAGFVTQLIACDRRMAQFRRARREDPTCAATAYGTGAGREVADLAIDLKV